jgi:Protein of unknown function (DUF2849)
MKVVTGNILATGRPAYRKADGEWSQHIEDAETFDTDEDAEAALAAARENETRATGTYLINVEAPGAPAQREAMRENIRAHGPTVHPAFGRQGEG